MLKKIKDKLAEFKVIQTSKTFINTPKINEYKLKIIEIENEINDLISKASGTNQILIKYIDDRVSELDNGKKEIYENLIRLSSVTEPTGIDKIENCIEHWNETTFDDKRMIVNTL